MLKNHHQWQCVVFFSSCGLHKIFGRCKRSIYFVFLRLCLYWLLLLLDAKMQQLQTFLFDRKWSDEKMRKLWFSFIILNYSCNCCTWCAIANGNMQMHFLLCLWYSLCIIYVFRFLCCALVKYFGQENKISCNMFLVL